MAFVAIVSLRETATANFGWETVHVELFLLSTYYVRMEYANLYIKLYLAIGTYAITQHAKTMYTNVQHIIHFIYTRYL